MSRVEELMTRLRSEDFRKDIEEWSGEVWATAESFYCGDPEGFEDLKDDWQGSLEAAFNACGWPEQFFWDAVENLSPPRVITADELADAFALYFSVARDRGRDHEYLYDSFLDHVEFRLLAERCSARFDLCELSWDDQGDYRTWMYLLEAGRAFGKAELLGTTPEVPPCPDAPGDEPGEWKLSTTGDVTLRVSMRASAGLCGRSLKPKQPTFGTLGANLIGRFSEKAMAALAEEIIPTIRSVFWSVALLCPTKCRILTGTDLPQVRLDDLAEYRAFINGCGQLLFLPQGKKETMDCRFHNALHLLAEADGQKSEAIRLALSVAAIEALLGQKTDGLSGLLADRIAVLLEPDTSYRSMAFDFVKKIYDLRSDTLHGNALDDSDVAPDSARRLAAGCLYALWFRYDFKRRLGEKPDAPAALLKELKERKWSTGQPGGIPDMPSVRQLWGATKPGDVILPSDIP